MTGTAKRPYRRDIYKISTYLGWKINKRFPFNLIIVDYDYVFNLAI